MKSNYFYSLLIGLFSLGLWSCNSDEMIEHVSLSTKSVVNDNHSVHEQVKNLYDSFIAKTKSEKKEAVNFPDYFGGSFVNENAELVILVKGTPNRYKDEFFQRVGNDKFILKQCENSYNELLAELDNLDKFYFNPNNAELKEELQINNYYVDTKNNNILIGLGDCSPHNIQNFNSYVTSSPLFVYEKMENGLARASGYEINNLLDYILSGPKGTYFRINNYISLGVEGTTATNFNITLQGKSFFISSFQCVNANPSGKYDMFMYTRTRLNNNYDIGGGLVRQQMGTYTMSGAFQDRGILLVAPYADAYEMEDMFRKADS